MIALQWLVACTAFEPVLPPLRDTPRVVEVEQVQERALPGVELPSDLVVFDEGEPWVLDSLAGRLVPLGGDGGDAVADPGFVTTLRATPSVGEPGVWLAVPDARTVLRVDREGEVLASLPLTVPDPIAILDLGEELVVGTRHGRLVWLEPSGEARIVHERGADGELLGAISDLAQLPDGRVIVADAMRARIHIATATGAWASWFGYYGPWIGSLSKPKAVLAGPKGTVWVADSGVGGVQLFETDGTPLGAAGVSGEPVAVPHPVALTPGATPNEVRVLSAVPGAVWTFTATDGAVQHAREQADVRHLRHTVVPADTASALCLQCHDGVVQDGRHVWSDGLAHPLGVPAPDAPAELPLEDGVIACATCHSPHPAARGEADTFLRMRRDALCGACHGPEPHGPVGSGHVTDLAGSCLGCHVAHGADRPPLVRDRTASEACADCHASRFEAGHHPVGTSVQARSGLPASVAVDCVDCHDLVGGGGGALLRADLSCTGCHTTLPAPHDRVRGDHGQSCLGCHQVHGSAVASLVRADVATDGCTACHPTPTAGHPTPDGCDRCHAEPHRPRRVEACADCHVPHALSSEQPHGSVACADCHPPHAVPRRGGPPSANPAARRCLTCHDDLASWRHPEAVFTTEGDRWTPLAGLPLYGDDGTPVAPDANGDLVCQSCHTVHGAADTLREGWKPACSACHGAEALVLYRWFHQPQRRSR